MKTESLSVSEAAKEAVVFSQQIYTAISCGKLSATRENGHMANLASQFQRVEKKAPYKARACRQ